MAKPLPDDLVRLMDKIFGKPTQAEKMASRAQAQALIGDAARLCATFDGAARRCRKPVCRSAGHCKSTRIDLNSAVDPCGRDWPSGRKADIMRMVLFGLINRIDVAISLYEQRFADDNPRSLIS